MLDNEDNYSAHVSHNRTNINRYDKWVFQTCKGLYVYLMFTSITSKLPIQFITAWTKQIRSN